ncbi:hypothetical protein SDJN03_19334, partial [Cucurbita argyrosperma subsp. sororia]
MEGKSKGYQASSFVADLFDVKEPPSTSSSEVFAAIFPSPQKGGGRNSSSSGDWLKQANGNQPSHARQGNSGGSLEPCHLSSSLYYGGQDGYSQAPSAGLSPSPAPTLKKSGGEDDPNGNNFQPASRGNWWQGTDKDDCLALVAHEFPPIFQGIHNEAAQWSFELDLRYIVYTISN